MEIYQPNTCVLVILVHYECVAIIVTKLRNLLFGRSLIKNLFDNVRNITQQNVYPITVNVYIVLHTSFKTMFYIVFE